MVYANLAAAYALAGKHGGDRFATQVDIGGDGLDAYCFTAMVRGHATLIQHGRDRDIVIAAAFRKIGKTGIALRRPGNRCADHAFAGRAHLRPCRQRCRLSAAGAEDFRLVAELSRAARDLQRVVDRAERKQHIGIRRLGLLHQTGEVGGVGRVLLVDHDRMPAALAKFSAPPLSSMPSRTTTSNGICTVRMATRVGRCSAGRVLISS